MGETAAPRQFFSDGMLMSMVGVDAEGYPQYELVNQMPPRVPRGPTTSVRPQLRPSEEEMQKLFEAYKAQLVQEAYNKYLEEATRTAAAMGFGNVKQTR